MVERLEDAFAAWARLAIRERRAFAGMVVLATLAFASGLPQLKVLNNVEAYLEPDDPTAVEYARFREEFGQDRPLFVALEPEEVYSVEFLQWLRELHAELEQVLPHVASVTSLINARLTRTEGDTLIVEGLLDEPPEEGDLAGLRERVARNPFYQDHLISDDGRMTVLVIVPDAFAEAPDHDLGGFDSYEADASADPTLSNRQMRNIIQVLNQVLARHQRDDVSVHVAGSIAVAYWLNRSTIQDVVLFLVLSVVMMSVVLALLFRRWVCVVVPLLVVLLSMVATVGAMAWAGAPLSLVAEVLPALLLVVGICDAVHVLTLFELDRTAGRERAACIENAMRRAGLPMLLTSITTAGGLASLASASVAPIVDLGFFAPLGVMLAFFYTMTLLPALLAMLPMPAPRRGLRTDRGGGLAVPIVRLGRLAVRHPARVLLPTLALAAACAAGAAGLRVGFHPLEWFPADHTIRVDTEAIDANLGGSMAMELLVETDRRDAFLEPEALARLEALGRHVEGLSLDGRPIRRTVSLADLVKEIHRALEDDAPEAYRIPDTREAVAQEILLFENTGSDDVDELTNSERSLARVTVPVPRVDSTLYADLVERETDAMQRIVGDTGEFLATGGMVILGKTGRAIGEGMVRSFSLAFLLITPIMMIFLGSVRRGLLSMVPNVFPVLVVLGAMRALGIPIDITALMVGGIVLGLAVDDTIHFMHGFQRHYAATRDVEESVALTLETTGVALLVTSVVLAFGFLMFTAGEMRLIAQFGLLAALATLMAFLADVLIAPALLSALLGRAPRA